jgi:hypothetical protein
LRLLCLLDLQKIILFVKFIKFFLLLLFIQSAILTQGQEKYTISGYVSDKATGEYLIGANVYIKELVKGEATNTNGFYSFKVEKGEYTLVASYLGYENFELKLNFGSELSIRQNIQLEVRTLKEVVVEADLDRNTNAVQMSEVEMEMKEVKKIPAFLGEVDILKTIQLLPGVQSAGEGNTGFYVRGGGPDQNLIILDDATVYNASHLFGFFSVFNADAIKNVNLIKGGIPAEYGGRLASVLDINMKEGNNKKFEGEGGIGLIASRLTLQGPIVKDKSSFIVSGRRTYIDVLSKPFIPKSSAFNGSGYYFYDLNAKLNYRFSDKDQLFISGYFGRDVFTFNSNAADVTFNILWGNGIGSLRWTHLFNDNLFMKLVASYSQYNFEFGGVQGDFNIKLFSKIRDYNAKAIFNYYPSNRHEIKFGAEYVRHLFTPNNATANQGATIFDLGEEQEFFGNEMAVFIQDEFDITDDFAINAGLRLSGFQHVGPFTRFLVNEAGEKVDTVYYNRGDNIRTYGGLEPRISLRYKINSRSSIKAAFTQNYQYVHLVSISTVSLPTDVWIPSTSIVEPQLGRQYNAGYFRNFASNKFEASVEVYYKTMENLVEYKEGVNPEDGIDNNEDNLLTFGSGQSYGIEFFFKKRLGKTTGWIGYTLSKTERQFEEINSGEVYPAKFDRRHDLSVVLVHEFNERWQVSGAFVYATGNAITLPEGRYFLENQLVSIYGQRNDVRMAAYHRLDLAATYNFKKEKQREDPKTGELVSRPKRVQSSLTLSVYNTYSRMNPYFIYFSTEGNFSDGSFKLSAKQVSLFPILPSITWNFKF